MYARAFMSVLLFRSADDERRDHAEHARACLGVPEDVAVERPRAQRVRDDDRVPSLARRDVQRVALERRGERIAIAREDLEREPMQVHGMAHLTLIHEAEPDALAELGRVRSGRRE